MDTSDAAASGNRPQAESEETTWQDPPPPPSYPPTLIPQELEDRMHREAQHFQHEILPRLYVRVAEADR